MKKASVRAVVEEMEGAVLGDKRRGARLKRVAERKAQKPGSSVSEAMVTPAEAQAAYQLLNCPDFGGDEILEPHRRQTLERCRQAGGDVLFLHDTTDFSFSGLAEREGLGPLNDGGQGFRGHFCFAVTRDRLPLGTVGVEHTVRERGGQPKPKRDKRQEKPEDCESLRWLRMVVATSTAAAGYCKPIHVMDSEADDYALFSLLHEGQHGFVIRAAQDRRVAGGGRLFQALDSAEHRLEREVPLSKRAPPKGTPRTKRNQPREARTARLAVSSQQVTLLRPEANPTELPKEVPVNVVHVREVDAPEGCDPVEWVLLTSEPIASQQDVERVVDAYRARWVIEELFRAIKTGCGFKNSQLESFMALEKWLAILLPVAWQLLLLRSAARKDPDAPATVVFTPDQLTVLGALKDAKLDPNPTVAQALAALARLGGYIRKQKPPGWIILGRALRQVNEGVELLEGLRSRSDQT